MIQQNALTSTIIEVDTENANKDPEKLDIEIPKLLLGFIVSTKISMILDVTARSHQGTL